MLPILTRLDLRLRRLPDWALFSFALAGIAALAAASMTDDGQKVRATDFLLLPVSAMAWLAHRRVYPYLTAAVAVAVTAALSFAASAHLGAAVAAGGARLAMYVIVIVVLGALRNERAMLMQAAATDSLTGAANGRAFKIFAERELERSRRYERPISLLFLDVDDFKEVNDRFGHAEGDRALEAIGRALQACVRRNDVVGRLGGDEFAVLMPEAGAEAAAALAHRMEQVVHRIKTPDGTCIHFSVGVATFATAPDGVRDLLHEAGRLMYQAKREGKDRMARSSASGPPTERTLGHAD
jgi:diguanylate cyclase (GGDEF)-like protein